MSQWRFIGATVLICLMQTHAPGQSTPIARQQFDAGGTGGIAFAADGKRLAWGGLDGSLGLWDAVGEKVKFRVTANKGGVYAVAFSPDGKWVLSGGADKQIRLWDAVSGKEVARLAGHDGAVTCLVFAADNQTLISGSADKTIRFWDFAGRKEIRKIVGHASGVFTLSLTGDNLLVSTGEMSEIRGGGQIHWTGPDQPRLWSIATGKEVRAYDIEVDLAVVSYDRRFLAITGVRTFEKPGQFTQIRVFELHDAATGRLLTELKGPGGALAFSPDGRTLAGVGRYGGLCLWEAATGRVVFQQTAAAGSVVTFSNDGKRIAWSDDGTGPYAPKAVPAKDELKAPRVRLLDWPPQREQWVKKAKDADPAGLWQDLAGEDSAIAYRAIWTLAAMPQPAVAFLKTQLKPPAVAGDLPRIRNLIAELDSDQFEVRRAAEEQLGKLGFEAELPLRQALDSGNVPLESRRRIQALLGALKLAFPLKGEPLREARALQVLEMVGPAHAETLLRSLTDGPANAPLVQDARRVLDRWQRQRIAR